MLCCANFAFTAKEAESPDCIPLKSFHPRGTQWGEINCEGTKIIAVTSTYFFYMVVSSKRIMYRFSTNVLNFIKFGNLDGTKGQLISKCLHGVIAWTKKPIQLFSRISALGSKERSNQKKKDTFLC